MMLFITRVPLTLSLISVGFTCLLHFLNDGDNGIDSEVIEVLVYVRGVSSGVNDVAFMQVK